MNNIEKLTMTCSNCYHFICCVEKHPNDKPCKLFAKKENVIVSPYAVGDTIYFITGLHNSLVKPAKVSEVYYGGENNFSFNVVTDNYVYFDLSLDETYSTYEAAEKDLPKWRIE